MEDMTYLTQEEMKALAPDLEMHYSEFLPPGNDACVFATRDYDHAIIVTHGGCNFYLFLHFFISKFTEVFHQF